MKKTYISPSMEVIKLNTANIIATSMAVYSDQTVDTSGSGVQLGREDNSSSSIWDQTW